MQRYVSQLVDDIDQARRNLAWPFVETGECSFHDWLSPSEEDATAPVRNLSEWTGITPDMLPPPTMLSDVEVNQVLQALLELLSSCNCHVVFQTQVPERLQYDAIRQNLDQNTILRQWHMGFFAFCKPGTPSKSCALGQYCQCAFYEELFSDFIDEDLSEEEARERELEIEIRYLKRKYGEDWLKYYPYHLDKNYDDENGNPFDYGVSDDEDDH